VVGGHLLAQRHRADPGHADTGKVRGGHDGDQRNIARHADPGDGEPAHGERPDPGGAEAQPAAHRSDEERAGDGPDSGDREEKAHGAVGLTEIVLQVVDQNVGQPKGQEDEEREQHGQGAQHRLPPQKPGAGQQLLQRLVSLRRRAVRLPP
jgi:hypothetical protein